MTGPLVPIFGSYADAEEAALTALHRHQDDLDAEPLIDRSFTDPAPNLILITRIVLEAVGFDRDDTAAEIRRCHLTVIDGGRANEPVGRCNDPMWHPVHLASHEPCRCLLTDQHEGPCHCPHGRD